MIISNFEISKKINMSKYGFSFSLSRLLGITEDLTEYQQKKGGLQLKIGASILKMFFK